MQSALRIAKFLLVGFLLFAVALGAYEYLSIKRHNSSYEQRFSNVQALTQAFCETWSSNNPPTLPKLEEHLRRKGIELRNPILHNPAAPCYEIPSGALDLKALPNTYSNGIRYVVVIRETTNVVDNIGQFFAGDSGGYIQLLNRNSPAAQQIQDQSQPVPHETHTN